MTPKLGGQVVSGVVRIMEPGWIECAACTREEVGTIGGDGLRTCDGVVDSNLHMTGRISAKEMVRIDLRDGAVACDNVGGGSL
jgi:hypothetical protein